MTYYNLVHHDGHERFAGRLVAAGIDACILPDLPLEESGPWCAAADDAGVETVMLAAPTAPDERLPRVVARCRGLRLRASGCSASRASATRWPPSATELAGRLKAITDQPVLVGVGVSNAEQAARGVRGRRRRGAGRVGRAPADGARPRRRRRLRRRGPRGDRRAAVSGDDRSALRAVRGRPVHRVVLRGRRLLDRRVRVVQRADGRVAGPRPDPPDDVKAMLHARLAAVMAERLRGRALRRRQPAHDPDALPRPRPARRRGAAGFRRRARRRCVTSSHPCRRRPCRRHRHRRRGRRLRRRRRSPCVRAAPATGRGCTTPAVGRPTDRRRTGLRRATVILFWCAAAALGRPRHRLHRAQERGSSRRIDGSGSIERRRRRRRLRRGDGRDRGAAGAGVDHRAVHLVAANGAPRPRRRGAGVAGPGVRRVVDPVRQRHRPVHPAASGRRPSRPADVVGERVAGPADRRRRARHGLARRQQLGRQRPDRRHLGPAHRSGRPRFRADGAVPRDGVRRRHAP